MTQAIKGHGAILKLGGVALPEVLDITGPAWTMTTTDVTSHDSPGGYAEWLSTMKDAGDVSFKCNHTVAGLTAMLANYEAQVPVTCSLAMPDGAGTIAFTGLVTDVSPADPVKGVIEDTVKVKSLGAATFAG